MTRQLARPEPLYVRFSDAFVILSVTLMSLAAGAWLIARLGLELPMAMLSALGVYCGLLVMHLLLRRALRGRAPDEDTEDFEEAEEANDPHWQSVSAAEAFEQALARHAQGEPPPGAGEMPRQPSQPGTWPEPLPMPAAPREDAQAGDPFTFRPSRGPHFEDEGNRGQPGADKGAAQPAMPPELNVELIQDLIKKLADELNSPAGEAEEAAAQAHVSAAVRGGAPEGMVDRSAAALDATARAMRAAPGQAGRAPTKAPAPSSRPAAPSNPRAGAPSAPAPDPRLVDPKLARVAEAVAAERMEVLLEPIHTLAEGRPRHYEVSMRLLAADGAAIEQRDYARSAVGSGLMPRIDAARMLRAARVAKRLSERGRQGSVLAAMAVESLTDGGFLDAAALQPGTDGRIKLVLSFSQADVRTFTPVHAEALGSMAAGGFGFALEDVTDLDMDFGALRAMGFEFVKLDAEVFLEGLRAPGGRVPAADICRYLSELGLTLIVGRIEDDWLLARVLGFGVLLGKGAFFGGPKLVKAEVVGPPGSAAAA